MSFLSRIFGDANERVVQNLQKTVESVNALESDFQKFSPEELKAKTTALKQRLADGESLDDILPEAFAAVREASLRVSAKRHFNVQLIGGMVLHQGKIAEMKTGEGKTLMATLPAFLNALTGKGVHIVTVNDYLARRDTAWMGQIYDTLGLTVGCINHDASYLYDSKHQDSSDTHDVGRDVEGGFRVVYEFLRPVERRDAYAADITYGTNNEYGFDYLRDNMVNHKDQMVQRGHHFAIVDEVDSILIDEARTPLIISAPDSESTKLYGTFARVVPNLVQDHDFTVDEKLKAISITEAGIEKVEKQLGIENIYAEGGVRYVHHLEQALKAHVLFKRDRDYVVKNDEVIIVDEFTGRLMPGRRWSEGLHQAVEAKEGVMVQKESRTLATITFQNYFRLYEKLSGMTGTAKSSAEEFHKVYNIDVVVVPTNKTNIRQDLPDRIYKNLTGKLRAIAQEVKERHEKGQPVLIGTVSIQKNEMLAALLEREGIPHNVLNAKNHEREAELHAQAGRLGAVTVATNMAGRGVDIILGGNPPDFDEAEKVKAAGGLHVIGTERHEARRIDDQLRGRAGRQGDQGSSQFFVSTEDDLARVFGGDRLKSIMDTLGISEDDVIENRFVSNALQQAQTRIEGHNFDIRKYVLEYDDVMNKHREAVYGLRKEVLLSVNNKELILSYITEVIDTFEGLGYGNYDSDIPEEFAKTKIVEAVKGILPLTPELEQKLRAGESQLIYDTATQLYKEREQHMGSDQMRQLERAVLLRTIDQIWMDHIEAMEYLRDSVRLRAYGQRDPLVEYKIEGQKMFENLLSSIKSQVANLIFKVQAMPQQNVQMQEIGPAKEMGEGSSSSKPQPFTSEKEPGRNDPCPCGSGKKYKKCHGA